MAGNTPDSIDFYLSISAQYRSSLAAIRHWDNLYIAYEAETIWIKSISGLQAESMEIRSMPFKRLFYSRENQLFPVGSLLPERTIPNLLWTAIQRGLAVSLPESKNNQKWEGTGIAIKLIPTDVCHDAEAIMVELKILHAYIEQAPAFRLEKLSWLILDREKALVSGLPLLPLPGATFWKSGNFLFPTGFQPEFPLLNPVVQQEIDPLGFDIILWISATRYFKIPKGDFRPLTIYSFRKSAAS